MLLGLASFEGSHQGFNAVFIKSETIHAEIVQRVEDMLTRRYPHLTPETRHLAAMVGVGIVKGLLPLTAQLPAEPVLAEIKTALLAYLGAVLARE